MFNIVGKRRWYFAISLLTMVPGIIFLLLGGLKLGIDFTGGTIWEVRFEREVATTEVRQILADAGFANAQVQLAEGNTVVIRTGELQEGSPVKAQIGETFRSRFGNFTELQIQTVGPSAGEQISRRAITAVALTSIGILLYIAYAFRSAQHPVRFGICAIVAMLHDVVVVVGIFAILGYFLGVEIDALFVTALLTVIGFSVHDTIVVFDRIRENTAKKAGADFPDIVNYSLVQTLVRSLNTSVTVAITLLALFLFGGDTLKNFVLALLIGIISGTYSSLFTASLLLVSWDKGEFAALLRPFQRRPRAVST